MGNALKIEADFKADLLVIACEELRAKWGAAAAQIPDDELLLTFFDSFRRRPTPRPRKIWIADDFRCPPEHLLGWEALQNKIQVGGDLSPHLSRGHFSPSNRDGLLNEWDVHHLHLGTALMNDGSGLIERTGPVLLARITDDDFFAINVYPHGDWEQQTIIDSLHRNWPKSLRPGPLRCVQPEIITPAQRRSLRRVNAHVATAVADGTVYVSIGGGVSSGGTSMSALLNADRMLVRIAQLQQSVEEQPADFLPVLQRGGYTNAPTVRASLIKITEQTFLIAFLDYGLVQM